MGTHLIGSILAILAALGFGSADLFGGVATRRFSPYAVLSAATLIGILPMAGLAIVFGESWPGAHQLFWAAVGGIAGVVGLAILYRGIAHGNVAIVSPVSGVVSATIPVCYGLLFLDLPKPIQLAGFLVAFIGIWHVTQEQNNHNLPQARSWSDVVLGGMAGFCFGLFFIALAQLKQGFIFGPLAVSKTVQFIIGFLFLSTQKLKIPPLRKNPDIILAGILDPMANALYVLATRFTRVDIAAVLSSLYPAGTILLAVLILKSPIHRRQWVGAGLCLVATALIMS